MFRIAFLAAGLCCATSTAVFADFSYEQSSKITGGAMAGMMKLAGAFSKAAREPIASTVMVKGDRMAHVMANAGANHISVIDLKSETITTIDSQKKTYSVITFADMAAAMQRMSEKMSQKTNDEKAEMNFKANIKETGEKKMVSGFNAKEVILTIDMEMKDPKSGNAGTMKVVSDMWLTPNIAGYDEVRDFYKRMSTKLAWTPGANPMMMQRSDMMKGMGELAKESAKLEGVPVLQIMKMGAAGDGTAAGQPAANSASRKESAPAPTASEAASSAIAGRLGIPGGFGGLGRKKKQQTEDAPAQQTQSAAPQSSDSSGSLMEMTTELTNFSSAPVDASRFEVPAGYKKVESQMEKALR